jgi:hypothetical protein
MIKSRRSRWIGNVALMGRTETHTGFSEKARRKETIRKT